MSKDIQAPPEGAADDAAAAGPSKDIQAPPEGAADDAAAAGPVNPPGTVSFRVLPKGAGQIHKGTHSLDEETGKVRFDTFAKGDTAHAMPAKSALELEDRGWVEILDVE